MKPIKPIKPIKLSPTTIRQLIIALGVFLGVLFGVLALAGAPEIPKKLLGGLLIVLAALFALTGLFPTEEPITIVTESESNIHLVTNITDGDTIEVDSSAKVRLMGIDAPEYGECYYEESKNALELLIQGEYVRLDKDVEAADTFKRLLRYVILPDQGMLEDNILVNNYMLKNGFAKLNLVSPNHRYRSTFTGSQQQAKETGQGLWTACADELRELKIGDLPPDPSCVIKGNISLKEYGKTYFTPDCPNYNQVKIEFSKKEQYFCTEQQARDAGFAKAATCP